MTKKASKKKSPPVPSTYHPAAKQVLGRPSKYKGAQHCKLVEEMLGKGKSLAQVASVMGVAVQKISEYQRRHPEFKAAVERGGSAALAWWETQGEKGLWAGKEFNAAVYQITMRNRFGWDKDQSPMNVTNNVLVADPAASKALLERLYPGVELEDSPEEIEAEARRIDGKDSVEVEVIDGDMTETG